jgi:hypothetical protein
MAMSTGDASGGIQSEPNVIPMIDIMLVMLIIFMVSQPLSRMALDVQVPPQEQQTKSDAKSNQIDLRRPSSKAVVREVGADPDLSGCDRRDGYRARCGSAGHRLYSGGRRGAAPQEVVR